MVYQIGFNRTDSQQLESRDTRLNRQNGTDLGVTRPALAERPGCELPKKKVSEADCLKLAMLARQTVKSSESKEVLALQTRVLMRLREAHVLATEAHRDDWDFSVELDEINKLGIPCDVIRSLLFLKLIEHRRETTEASGFSRSFLSETDLFLSPRSCFVLTKSGLAKTEELAMEARKLAPNNEFHSQHHDSNPYVQTQPIWDDASREFRLGPIVVKRFKWPARNQEQILRAFQQNNWPQKISNPLPSDNEVCSKAQLHDTIKCLNRNQVNKAIKFRGDGTGKGVFWEIVPENESSIRNG